MKLLVQIPCLDEEDTIQEVVTRIPRDMSYLGITGVKVLLLDDSSRDSSVRLAEEAGVDFVLRSDRHIGLAQNYNRGLRFALEHKFDLLVNLDGDLQYFPEDIPKLIQPIVFANFDLVFGVRGVSRLKHMSRTKKFIHRWGCQFIGLLVGEYFSDPVTGFRAFNRKAMSNQLVSSRHTYTVESLFLAHSAGLRCSEVCIRVKPTNRGSRLIKNIPEYVFKVFRDILRVKWEQVRR